jgi:hypothetical protein
MPSPLEMPPPPPSQVGQPGPPSLQGLAGDQGQGQQPGQGDQSLQIVTQHLMEAEQALQAAARIKPELSSIVDKFINEVKPQAGQLLFGGGTQAGAAGSGGMPPSNIGGLMASGMGPAMNARP